MPKPQLPDSDGKTVADLAAILRRRKWNVVVPALLVFCVAAAAAFLIPRTYRSTTTILIEEQEIPREYVATNITSFADQRLQTINQRIMSTTKLIGAINRFRLYEDRKDRETIDEIVGEMRKDIKFATISADVIDPRSGRPAQATIAFSVSYEGRQPETVQQVAAELASLYLEENIRTRERQSSETFKFMEDEMRDVQTKMAEIDNQIAAYKQIHPASLPEPSPRVAEGYRALVVERNSLQAKYDELTREAINAKGAHGLEKEQPGERFTIVEAARLPEKPASPNIPAILLIGLVLGLGSGVGYAALKEAADTTVHGLDRLAAAMPFPALVAIPEIVTRKDFHRQTVRYRLVAGAVVVAIGVGVALFHFFVMDLDVLWARLSRRFL